MLRTVSRSHCQATNPPVVVGSQSHRIALVGCKLLLAVACALSGNQVRASDPDNVLLDFTATWCGPCQQMSSIVSKLQRQGLPVRKVDVDQESALASKYRVESIPCFVLVANGKEIDRVSGITTEQQLKKMLNRLPKDEAIAETAPDNRRSDPKTGPSLGRAIPITTVENDARPRQDFPGHDFADRNVNQFPAAPTTPRILGQSPDPDPLRASVRIRVKDGTAINYGSGTIIESQVGQATILSCGHIFRKLSKNAVIEIDLYTNPGSAKPETVAGRVIVADMDADVALVGVNCSQRVTAVPLCAVGTNMAIGDHLFSIGCSSGDNPSRENVDLTFVNRYRGPENLECTNRPLKGRSGGGLFRDGELVGVCIAADPEQPRGLYTSLQPICLLLEKAGYGHLNPRPRAPQNAIAIGEPQPLFQDPPASKGISVGSSSEEEIGRLLMDQMSNLGDPTAAPATGDYAGAEIVCIVRSKTPGTPSRVVIINQASDRLIGDLMHESGPRTGLGQTTANRTTNNANSRGIETSYELQQQSRRPRTDK